MDARTRGALLKMKRLYKPIKMIVFGSAARGDMHEGSDIDVILIKNTERRFTDRIEDVLKLWTGDCPLDPFVYTPKEFKAKLQQSDFLQTAVSEGAEL